MSIPYLTLLIIVLIFFTIINFISCDSTEPENIKSPRDYTWTVDTVYNPNNPQTLMSSIWGSSENNIYICGHSSASPGGLWHYDGNKWEVIDLFKEIGYGANLTGVHGTTAQNVWVVGYQRTYDKTPTPYVIKYNGAKWEKIELNVNTAIYSVFVKDINDVWVCGSDGIVAHYDQGHLDWEIDTLSVNLTEGAQYNLYSISNSELDTYVYGNVVEADGLRFTYYIFQRKNDWKTLDSFVTDNTNATLEWGINKLYNSNIGTLYTIGGGLWKRSNSSWTKLIPYSMDFRSFHERGSDNMIIAGSHSEIYHFNGNNWQKLDMPNDAIVHYRGIWMEENITYIMGILVDVYPQKTIVFKGK